MNTNENKVITKRSVQQLHSEQGAIAVAKDIFDILRQTFADDEEWIRKIHKTIEGLKIGVFAYEIEISEKVLKMIGNSHKTIYGKNHIDDIDMEKVISLYIQEILTSTLGPKKTGEILEAIITLYNEQEKSI